MITINKKKIGYIDEAYTLLLMEAIRYREKPVPKNAKLQVFKKSNIKDANTLVHDLIAEEKVNHAIIHVENFILRSIYIYRNDEGKYDIIVNEVIPDR